MKSRGRATVRRTMTLNWLRKICRWPETTEMTRADFERLLDTVPPSNSVELGDPRRDAVPRDARAVIIASGPMGLRIENGEHRLRAGSTAAMKNPVEMLLKLKKYKTEDEYRQSLHQHDQLVKRRTIAMQAEAAGKPIPKLGLRRSDGMIPSIFWGAVCLMTEFGTMQKAWPMTYETWLRHVLPALEEPIKTLTDASQCESAYNKQDRFRIECKLYQTQPTALLLEFCRVDPEKARTFIEPPDGRRARAAVRPHPQHQRLDPERGGEGLPGPGPGRVAPHHAHEAHQRLGIAPQGPQPAAQSRHEEAREDPRLEPDLVARVEGEATPRGRRHRRGHRPGRVAQRARRHQQKPEAAPRNASRPSATGPPGPGTS